VLRAGSIPKLLRESRYRSWIFMWRGLEDHLELVIVLQAVGIFAVATVGRTPGRLDVGDVPGFRPENAQKGGGIEGAGAFFQVVGLLDDAPLAAQ
jgi:hypothetical protein